MLLRANMQYYITSREKHYFKKREYLEKIDSPDVYLKHPAKGCWTPEELDNRVV